MKSCPCSLLFRVLQEIRLWGDIVILEDYHTLETKKIWHINARTAEHISLQKYNSIFILAHKQFSRNTVVFIKWYDTVHAEQCLKLLRAAT